MANADPAIPRTTSSCASSGPRSTSRTTSRSTRCSSSASCSTTRRAARSTRRRGRRCSRPGPRGLGRRGRRCSSSTSSRSSRSSVFRQTRAGSSRRASSSATPPGSGVCGAPAGARGLVPQPLGHARRLRDREAPLAVLIPASRSGGAESRSGGRDLDEQVRGSPGRLRNGEWPPGISTGGTPAHGRGGYGPAEVHAAVVAPEHDRGRDVGPLHQWARLLERAPALRPQPGHRPGRVLVGAVGVPDRDGVRVGERLAAGGVTTRPAAADSGVTIEASSASMAGPGPVGTEHRKIKCRTGRIVATTGIVRLPSECPTRTTSPLLAPSAPGRSGPGSSAPPSASTTQAAYARWSPPGVTREIDRDDVVTPGDQLGREPLPAPRAVLRTVDEPERHHRGRRQFILPRPARWHCRRGPRRSRSALPA